MLKQVALSVKGPNLFKDLARKFGCKLELVDCKNFNSHGMSLLMEIGGARSEELIEELKSCEGIKRVYFEKEGSKTLAMVILDAPVYCRIAQECGAFCVSCPLKIDDDDEEEEASTWKMLVKDASGLDRTIEMLESSGVQANVRDVSNASHGDVLTPRQREILLAAIRLGYFDFPRKHDLTRLAEELSIKPSTLSEILRRAEAKMARYYLESIRP